MSKTPASIDKFLGLNLDEDGETGIKLGESTNMLNFRITDHYKLKKREGYQSLFNALGSKIQGMWYGKINGTNYLLFACGGKVYKRENNVNVELGTLTDDKTYFFAFNEKVYIMNGHQYKYWDGTNFGVVQGYTPLVAINTPPSGGGTLYEGINILTGAKHQWFSSDGASHDFVLAERNVDIINYVYVNGVKLNSSDYMFNPVSGTVILGTIPSVGENNVDIGWTKNNFGINAIQRNYKALVFGGSNDSRIHVYGGNKNTIYYSGLANGVPSAEYFPVLNYMTVGSDEYTITDMVRQYDRAIIFTEKDTWYTYYDTITDVSGNTIAAFPVLPLNSERGNVAFGQCQLINNNPVSISKGVYEWISTNIRDERNATLLSDKVQQDLLKLDLSKAVTCDWQENGEYWLCVNGVVYVFNYMNETWYKFNNIDASCFLVIDGKLYFGTSQGTINKFSNELRNDNDVAIPAYWEMEFYSFDADYLRKYINRMWLSMKPEQRSRVVIKYATDKTGYSDELEAFYNFATFETMDFNNFSFKTNNNPQPFRFKIKAKKFVYFKLMLDSSFKDEVTTILNINLAAQLGGEAK